MTHYYKYEGMREEDRNALIPAILKRSEPEEESEEECRIESQNAFREHRYSDVIRLSGIDETIYDIPGNALDAAVDALQSRFPGWDYAIEEPEEECEPEPCYYINGDHGNPIPHDWTDAGEGFSRCRHCKKVVE